MEVTSCSYWNVYYFHFSFNYPIVGSIYVYWNGFSSHVFSHVYLHFKLCAYKYRDRVNPIICFSRICKFCYLSGIYVRYFGSVTTCVKYINMDAKQEV